MDVRLNYLSRKLKMPTRFDAFDSMQEDGGDSHQEEDGGDASRDVPGFEDLSSFRADEETVLYAVCGDDFSIEDGVWGCARLNINVRPPDTARENVGSEFTLSAQLGKKYPYVAPTFELRNVRGLTQLERKQLMDIIVGKAQECAMTGSVIMCEVVQEAEDFLSRHNKDPTKANQSAWEQMKEREAAEEEERHKRRELEEARFSTIGKDIESNDVKGIELVSAGDAALAIEARKELLRQMEALDMAAADRQRIKRVDRDFFHDDESLEENRDFDDEDDGFDDDAAPLTGTSRYKQDFIELGLLGRGGGGEVVKVRNRLDRRVYAIKKIPLESEAGRKTETSKIQNNKLRREVTTISRMSHQHIVRYYQAWVEGGEERQATIDEETSLVALSTSEEDLSGNSDGDDWWSDDTRSIDGDLSCGGIDLADPLNGKDLAGLQRASTKKLTEHMFHNELKNPLFAGFRDHDGKFGRQAKASSHMTFSSDLEDSVKVTDSDETLYIQMEFCHTTLRATIDDGKALEMGFNEPFRWVRQIVEGLEYVHSRKIIHRDLKVRRVFAAYRRHGHIHNRIGSESRSNTCLSFKFSSREIFFLIWIIIFVLETLD